MIAELASSMSQVQVDQKTYQMLRCPSCDEAVVRIGRTSRGLWLDLRRAATIVTVSAGIRPESEVCIIDHG